MATTDSTGVVLSGPIRHCEQCGDVLVRTIYPSGAKEGPSRFKNRRFCSRKCHSDSREGVKRLFVKQRTLEECPSKTCPECGTVFNRRPSEDGRPMERLWCYKKRIFCDMACYGKYVKRMGRHNLPGIPTWNPGPQKDEREEWQ